MPKHVFLFDITRHNGPVRNLLGSARASFSLYDREVVEWIALAVQPVEPVTNERLTVVGSSAEVSTYIDARIRSMSAQGEFVFHVYSYEATVLNHAGLLNSPSRSVCPTHMVIFADTRKTSAFVQTRARAHSSASARQATLTLVEAIELTKRVLRKLGHVSREAALKQTYLRKMLTNEDPRAEKDWSDPDSVKLITRVVSTGLRDAWLDQARIDGKSGTEMIWLKAQRDAQAVPPEPVTKESLVNADKGQKRTDQMVSCLKSAGLYCPKDARDYIFDSVARIVEATEPHLSVAKLARQTSVDAQKAASEDGLSFQYWYAACEGAFQTMLRAGVLLDETQSEIMPGARARSTRVGAIVSDFRGKCDLFLLEYLINTLKDVTVRDCTSLAHALFKQSPKKTTRDQMLDQVDQLFERFGTRLMEDDDGLLSVEPEERPQAAAAARA